MDSKFLHNLKDTPYNERETFNNAILLLSMVKSEYYYIVGFSRPKNQIEIGFDFEDKIYGKISETITVDFSSNPSSIKIATQLTNIFLDDEAIIPLSCKNNFSVDNGYVYYERLFEEDDIIPVSMEKLNAIILKVKEDVGICLAKMYEYILKR